MAILLRRREGAGLASEYFLNRREPPFRQARRALSAPLSRPSLTNPSALASAAQ
jgi:hypothetical protein